MGEGDCPICGRPRWAAEVMGLCEHTDKEWSDHIRGAFSKTLEALNFRPTPSKDKADG